MYSDKHYIPKLRRNINVLDKAPEDIREEVLNNIIWVKALIDGLPNLDRDQREAAITQIHSVLDSDYEKMGFSLGSRSQ